MSQFFLQRLFTKTVGLGVILLLILGSGVAAATSADDETGLPVYEEEEVVITATRTRQEESKSPGKTEVITKEEIEATGAATVAEVLQREGVVISAYGGASGSATVQLDGATAEQTLVLINGVPANGGTGGYVDLSYFPVAGVERIEVAHGPLSALYGANALGGVVNIITDLTGPVANQVSLTGGSNASGKIDFASEQSKYGFAFGGFATDGYREHSATKTGYFMGQYDFWQTMQKALRLNLMYNVKNYQSPGTDGSTSIDDGIQEYLDLNLSGRNVWDQWTIEYNVYGQYNKMDYHSYYPAYDFTSEDRYRTTVWGSDLAGNYQMGAQQILVGLQLKQTKFDSSTVGQHTWDTNAWFFQDSWQINPKWQWVSGLRWDNGSAYVSPVCPRFSVNYAVSDQFTVKLGYGKAFRAPAVDDLYWPESSYYYDGATYYYQGNSALKPETSERYEITGEWRRGGQSVSVNCFTANVVDCIEWKLSNYVWMPVNIDKMQIYGGSLSWKSQLNQSWSTGIKYAWTDRHSWSDATQSYSVDENSFGKNRFTVNLGYRRDAWHSNLDWNWVTERNDDQSDYAVVNYCLTYQMNEKLSYGLTIVNLTDEAYEVHTGYPMPGREYYLTANYKL
jgi:outer membrane cobalamin receptor